MNTIQKQLQQIQATIPHLTITNNTISKASVGWHLEHILTTINVIIQAVKKSDASTYKKTFSFPRLMVLTFKKIPRGKAKAPSSVLPQNDITTNSLTNHVALTQQKLAELNNLQLNNYFNHPYFGHINLKPTIKFLAIHTQHHLNIVNDILKTVQ